VKRTVVTLALALGASSALAADAPTTTAATIAATTAPTATTPPTTPTATAPPPPTTPATTTPGRPAAPPFSLKDLQGKPLSLASLRGKVVVVNFWATWCGPCLQELPVLDQFQQKRGKDGLVVVAIATDGPETAAQIAPLVRRRRLTMPVAHDRSGTVISALNPRAANPYTLFIDRQGRIAHRHEGYSPGDERVYETYIDALLAER
jgi:thiol-disulfide isomerase/thioredoxin